MRFAFTFAFALSLFASPASALPGPGEKTEWSCPAPSIDQIGGGQGVLPHLPKERHTVHWTVNGSGVIKLCIPGDRLLEPWTIHSKFHGAPQQRSVEGEYSLVYVATTDTGTFYRIVVHAGEVDTHFAATSALSAMGMTDIVSIGNSATLKAPAPPPADCRPVLAYGGGEVHLPSGEWVRWHLAHFGIVTVCASYGAIYGKEAHIPPPVYTVERYAGFTNARLHFVTSTPGATIYRFSWDQEDHKHALASIAAEIMAQMGLETRGVWAGG